MNKIVAAVKRKGLPFEFVEYMGMNGVIKSCSCQLYRT